MTAERTPPSRPTRILAALSLLALTGSFLAAQIDFAQRYRLGMAPARYWLPQLTHIWLPGLAAAFLLAMGAWLLRRRGRGS